MTRRLAVLVLSAGLLGACPDGAAIDIDGGPALPDGGQAPRDGGDTEPDGGDAGPDGGDAGPDGGDAEPDGGPQSPDDGGHTALRERYGPVGGGGQASGGGYRVRLSIGAPQPAGTTRGSDTILQTGDRPKP